MQEQSHFVHRNFPAINFDLRTQNSAQAKNKHPVTSMRQQIQPSLWLDPGYKIDQWLSRYDRHVSGAPVSSCATGILTSEDSNLATVLKIKNCAIVSFVRTD